MTVNVEQHTTSTSPTVCQGQDPALLMEGQADGENDEDGDQDDFFFKASVFNDRVLIKI